VPRLDYEIRVVDRIQCHGDISSDLNDSGKVEDPAEEADPAREEANNPTPPGVSDAQWYTPPVEGTAEASRGESAN